jgi:CRP-like cAMP-binding protein
MPSLSQIPYRNYLLAALAPDDVARLEPHLEPVTLGVGDNLSVPNKPIEHVYFPESGIGSMVAITGEHRIEVGLFGRDGLSGTPLLLGSDRTPHEVFVQVAGQGLRMPSNALREVVGQSPALLGLLLRYVQAFTVQTAYTALSNGSETIEERLARWLLMSHDRVDGDELPLTHKFLSLMLGVQRTGVTLALHVLEGAQVISTRRGLITVVDRAKLEEVAGESYGVPEAEYTRLIGPLH